MTEYHIRKLENNEFELLIPLMINCFGIEVNIKYFEWKFVNNPAGFVQGYIAVTPENEIAAYYGVIPEFYMINGEERIIYQSCDTMTHSSHRRKGLFQKLALHCYESLRESGSLFVIGFGGGQSTPGFLKFGWQQIFVMKHYFFPRQRFIGKTSFNQTSIKEIHDLTEIEQSIQKSNTGSSIHSKKTLEIFRWRISNPKHHYKVIGLETANGFDSYLCFYIDGNRIILFDFYFTDKYAAKSLTTYLKKIMKRERCTAILAFLQENSIASKILRKTGFISNPFSKGPLSLKVPFIFYTSDEEMKTLNDPSKWTIGAFDHDAL